MPNWCENTLRIVPVTDAARALLPQIAERFTLENESALSAFQLIHPMPVELEGTVSPGDSPNWYDWRVANWGTKWQESEPYVVRSLAGELLVSFQTAWSPPIGIYRRLCELGFAVFATYAEGGMGFAGYWENGNDTEVDLSSLVVMGDDEEDYPEDFEVLQKAFAGFGLSDEMLPPGLGG
jgi:Ferredoxin-like domain in Api92-like protein